jgi:hypothetical protein
MADGGRDEVFFRICPVHGRVKENDWNGHSCKLCIAHNAANGGRRKAQPLRERYEDDGVERYTYSGDFDIKDFQKYMERLSKDPARMAAALSDARRPRRVDRVRFGVAVRKSEPMLNASAASIRYGLSGVDDQPITHAKKKVYRTVKVKPTCMATAKMAGGSWRERDWTVWTLEYSDGLVLVTEDGKESSVFSGWKSLVRAINGSGWGIIG